MSSSKTSFLTNKKEQCIILRGGQLQLFRAEIVELKQDLIFKTSFIIRTNDMITETFGFFALLPNTNTKHGIYV